jgi:polysaccharide deacetylase family protein (PEP-CTERM system associated)
MPQTELGDLDSGPLLADEPSVIRPMAASHPARAEPASLPGRQLLGISLEDYFHVGAFRGLISTGHWRRFESRLEHATGEALDLLDAYNARATFFTLGWVAEHLPELVRSVVARGHEVANSGYAHRGIAELGPDELRDELDRGREAILRATGTAPLGVRVPDWLRERDLWALDVIAGRGYAYDASFRPLGTDCRGAAWKRRPFTHVAEGVLLDEFPVPTLRVGPMLLPIGGGNWFRQLPEQLVVRAVERWQRESGVPFSMYFQVWELDPAQPRITAASWLATLRHYRNLDRTERFLRRFLGLRPFVGYAEYLGCAAAPPARAAEESGRATTALAVQAATPPRAAPCGRVPVTIVVPCFNEADTLPYLLNTLDSVERQLGQRYRLSYVFVDDGSSDDTWGVLQSLVGARPDCERVRHPANRGIAHAILTGIAASRDEFVCSIDADCTYDPHQLAALLPALEAGADLVTASPYHPDGRALRVPRWRLMLSRTLSRMYSHRLGSSLHTYTSCFRAYRRSRFVGLSLSHHGFLGVAEILVRALLGGAVVVEVPATLEVRLLGRSKLRVLRVIAGHIRLLNDTRRWQSSARRSLATGPASATADRHEVSR